MMAYVDESVTEKDYLLGAGLVDELDLDMVRYAMDLLLTKEQPKVRWHEESVERREFLAHALSKVQWWEHLMVVRVARTGERMERQRRLCLERLWYELVALKVDNVVLECRDRAQDRSDRDHLDTLRARRVLHRNLRIRHVPGSDDPLLACADIVAKAYRAAQRGKTEYLDELRGKLRVIEVEPNWGR